MSQIVYSNKLPTGTKFFGRPDALGMQEYGLYVYPDGTRYMGYFLNDKFHGNGYIELPEPHGVNFRVVHQNGKLTKIMAMSFKDELEVDFTYENNTMTFENWTYCCAPDRRLHGETVEELEAVAPFQQLGRQGNSLPLLQPNIFDLGFGKFNRYGFVTDVPGHLSETSRFYVGCRGVRRWIRENCCHGGLVEAHIKKQVLAKYARQIIDNNLASEAQHNTMMQYERGQQHSRLCRRSKSQISSSSAKKMRLHMASTSDTVTSEANPQLQLQRQRQQAEQGALRRAQSDSSICHIN